jgi:hypothetical protein
MKLSLLSAARADILLLAVCVGNLLADAVETTKLVDAARRHAPASLNPLPR